MTGPAASQTRVFSYGSLIDEPERPERLVSGPSLAWWTGHERAFNLRSRYRACAADQALLPEAAVPEFVVDGGLRESLVLGTIAQPGHRMPGAVLAWSDPDGSVLAALDAREGYDPADEPGSAYLRREARVELPDGSTRPVWVYLSNPHHPRYIELPLATQAAVLLHATPSRPPTREPRLPGQRPTRPPCGAQYALPVAHWLRAQGVHDVKLEALYAELTRLAGVLATHPALGLRPQSR